MDERAALEALKAEVRCIGHGDPAAQKSTTMGRLKTELNRLQASTFMVCLVLVQLR